MDNDMRTTFSTIEPILLLATSANIAVVVQLHATIRDIISPLYIHLFISNRKNNENLSYMQTSELFLTNDTFKMKLGYAF